MKIQTIFKLPLFLLFAVFLAGFSIVRKLIHFLQFNLLFQSNQLSGNLRSSLDIVTPLEFKEVDIDIYMAGS